MALLVEAEKRPLTRSVGELDGQHSTGAGEALLGLPDIRVRVRCRVVGQATVRLCRRPGPDRVGTAGAVVFGTLREACLEDVNATETAERELDGHGSAGLHLVDVGHCRDGPEEAAETV